MTPYEQKQVEGAIRYAKADRSDPFAFNRAMSHIQNGICRTPPDKGGDYGYSAKLIKERRSYDTGAEKIEFFVDAYIDIQRP